MFARQTIAAPASLPSTSGLACDDSLKSRFKPDADTTVTLVKEFKEGDDLHLAGEPSGQKTAVDLCLVKLNVGPGHEGPSDMPSTSRGIGIQIWLPSPAHWTGRIHALGGGYVGSPEISSLTQLGMSGLRDPSEIADIEGDVSAVTDTGHVGRGIYSGNMDGSFAMNPDGSFNESLWADFSRRGVHEMALKTKLLTAAYYGKPARYSYFDGCSTGGRQAHMTAQEFPDDFDGNLAGAPALYWTRLIVGGVYPQIVMARDLSAPLSNAQLRSVSSVAVSACDTDLNGQHAGYISDPAMCRYDPTRDRQVLCKADGGENETTACVSPAQAQAINKIWYGETADGSVPVPAKSNGYSSKLGNLQLWFGLPRGTQAANLVPGIPGLAGSIDGVAKPFIITTTFAALILDDPKIATPDFVNATGSGENGWRTLSYADLARVHERGITLRREFNYIDTDNPDLDRFRDHGRKMLLYHGMADQVIPIQGSTHYYEQVADRMGGYAAIERFYRYYPVPGIGHCVGSGSLSGISGVSPAVDPPLLGPNQLYAALVDWVENGRAPPRLVLKNSKGTVSRPLCEFPRKLKYMGGDRSSSDNYECR
jgi:hypothetical protein